MHVEIYGRLTGCPYCTEAKAICERDGYDYKFLEIGKDVTRDRLLAVVAHHTDKVPRTVPQIFVDGKYIGGCDDFKAHLKGE